MEVLATPIITFVALIIVILMLGINLYVSRARANNLEQQVFEARDAMQSTVELLHDALAESLDTLTEENKVQLADIKKSFLDDMKVSREQIFSQIHTSATSLDSSLSALITESKEVSSEESAQIQAQVKQISETVKNNAVYNKGIVERMGQSVSKDVAKSEQQLLKALSGISENLAGYGKASHEQLSDIDQKLANYTDSNFPRQVGNIIDSVNQAKNQVYGSVQDSAAQLADSINLVRLSNVITENRNLYDQGRLVIETESFVKTFDHCQLTQVEDKQTGQVTKNEFEDGQICRSKTYRTDSLEYVGTYKNGALLSMEDHTGPEGSVTHYEYDEAGEVEIVK